MRQAGLREFCLAAALAATWGCGAPAPDTVIYNAKVFTADAAQPWAEALSIRGDRIVGVGASDALVATAGDATRRIDAGGRVVIPGFNDAHAHTGPARPLVRLTSSDDPSVAELEAALAKAVGEAAPGQFIQGSIGQTVWDDLSVTRAWLDARAPNHPVRLSAWTGHGVVLNSAALQLARVDDSAGDPEGGRLFRDASGRLNGRAIEYGDYWLARRLAEGVDEPRAVDGYRAYAAAAAEAGVTSIQLMGDALPVSAIMKDLVAADTALRWHVYRFPLKPAGEDTIDSRPHLPPQPAPTLDARGLKFIIDGTPIERGAFLRQPYADAPATRGALNFTPDRLKEFVGWGYSTEDQLAMHAVGDAAIDAYLAAMEHTGLADVWKEKRPRIEHGDLLTPDLLARAKALGVVVVQNPAHLALGDALTARLGAARMAVAQPLKSLLAAGIPLAIGSDGVPNPFLNLMFAVTHPARPSEALSREQAVAAYTSGSAFAERQDRDKGRLFAGALADLAVLSADIFTVPADQLPATTSVLTMVGGRVVYDRGVVR